MLIRRCCWLQRQVPEPSEIENILSEVCCLPKASPQVIRELLNFQRRKRDREVNG